jgi:hypothetical protein
MQGIPRVILLIETSHEFGRELIRGITRYSRIYGPWVFSREPRGLRGRFARHLRAARHRRRSRLSLYPYRFSGRRQNGGGASAGARIQELRLLRVLRHPLVEKACVGLYSEGQAGRLHYPSLREAGIAVHGTLVQRAKHGSNPCPNRWGSWPAPTTVASTSWRAAN